MKYSILFLFLILSHVANAKVCLEKKQIRGSYTQGVTELHLLMTNQGEYKLAVAPCFNMMFATRLVFQTYPLNSLQVCPGDDVVATDPDGKTDSCNIQDIEKIK